MSILAGFYNMVLMSLKDWSSLQWFFFFMDEVFIDPTSKGNKNFILNILSPWPLSPAPIRYPCCTLLKTSVTSSNLLLHMSCFSYEFQCQFIAKTKTLQWADFSKTRNKKRKLNKEYKARREASAHADAAFVSHGTDRWSSDLVQR